MTARLIEAREGGTHRRDLTIHDGGFVIGRGADCDLRVPVAAISRHHCLIRVQGQQATLVDLRSSNGTFLNGRPVHTPTPLHSGDEIRVGACSFVVDLGGNPSIPDHGDDPNTGTMKLGGVDRARDNRSAVRSREKPATAPAQPAGARPRDGGVAAQRDAERTGAVPAGGANWSSYDHNLLEAWLDV
jgi:predicted component of type VI protein secretion system